MTLGSASGTPSAPLTVRVAAWSARHRWPVVAAWFVLTIGLFAVSLAMGGTRTFSQMDSGDVNTESARAEAVFGAAGTGDPKEDLYVVIRSAALTTDDPAYQAAVTDIATRLRAVTDETGQPALDSLIDPYSVPAAAAMFSADGSSVQLLGSIGGENGVVSTLGA